MTIKAFSRGHEIEFFNKSWKYSDNNTPIKKERKCNLCGELPTEEGYDVCIGKLKGVISACCGHGVEKGTMVFEDFMKSNQAGIFIINPSWLEYLLNLFFQGYLGEVWEEIMDTKIDNARRIENWGYGIIGQEFNKKHLSKEYLSPPVRTQSQRDCLMRDIK